jgi:beta-glucosidase
VLAGLFSRPVRDPDRSAGDFAVIGSAAHRALAREAVRKSLVLLKNNGHLLPLRPNLQVLVAGDAADDVGLQSGGWTIDWQGNHNSARDFPGATSVFQGIQAAVAAGGGSATLSKTGQFTRRPDVAIVVFGEAPYAEFQGDRENLAFSQSDARPLQLLRRLRRQAIPTVAVFISGRPLWVNPELNAVDAFVAAWLPGSEGEGVADVLFRGGEVGTKTDFTGRLGFSWPRTAMPVTFDAGGHVTGAQFERGYGLDYGTNSTMPTLSVEPRIAARYTAPAGSLFRAGHPTAPWTLFVSAGNGEDEMHVTTRRQSSPGGALTVTLATDFMAAAWDGSGNASLRISGRARDLVNAAGAGTEIELRYRLDTAPSAAVGIGMRCTEPLCRTTAGAMLEITPALRRSGIGGWHTLRLPLSCYARMPADLSSVEEPVVLATSGRLGLTIADVRLRPRGATTPACPSPLNR